MSTVVAQLTQLIHREGPITFDRFMEIALYGEGGFFAAGHGAGRAGRDFVTSPEVGPLFGACTARALDRLWRALDEPDPFLVVAASASACPTYFPLWSMRGALSSRSVPSSSSCGSPSSGAFAQLETRWACRDRR